MKFIYNKISQIPQTEVLKEGQRLVSYVSKLSSIAEKRLYTEPASCICLPEDHTIREYVYSTVKKLQSNKLKYIFVVGIGGSNLGTKAIYDALLGSFDSLQPTFFPKIIFMDTVNPTYAEAISDCIQSLGSRKEFLILIITKSGTTSETIANAEFLLTELSNRFSKLKDRIVIITDEASKLHSFAKTQKLLSLTVPETVGGRFSVFSAVGLLPLAFTGIDISALLDGALGMRNHCIVTDVKKNPALLSAAVLYNSYTSKRTIHDTFVFASELESLGKWYRQLLGESIGKEGKGMTPTVSVGSADLHSVGQLYLDGPRDKITTFVYAEHTESYPKVPNSMYTKLVPEIRGRKFSEIMEAIRKGVRSAYLKQKRPFMEVGLPEIDEQSLGEFMQFKMLEVMYLAQLLKVNAFDQPAVELYKKETRRLLHKETN